MISPRKKTVLAGASGFVGKTILKSLKDESDWIALSRTPRPADPDVNVEWRTCDLYSLKQTESAVQGADTAIYLVHSMMPQDRLTQASFADLDLICADNFGRACKRAGVKKIIYLGGLIPKCTELSAHLKSRLEVEEILASHGIPVITLRAGLIIGQGGSSFEMMVNLIKRLPFMICPAWTKSLTQPIALTDILQAFKAVLSRNDWKTSLHFDLGCSDQMTYLEMMRLTALKTGRRLRFLVVPWFSPKLSRLWVSLFSGYSLDLVKPLIESLRHDMVASGEDFKSLTGKAPLSFAESLDAAFNHQSSPNKKAAPHNKLASSTSQTLSTVRSVQRLPLPSGMNAAAIVVEYFKWLPRFLSGMFNVTVDDDGVCRFYFRWIKSPLLVLKLSQERSSPDRQLLYIEGGLLVKKTENSRFEFREVLDRRFVIAAIHDYQPSLPWFIYLVFQAPFHFFVMQKFSDHLKKTSHPQNFPS